MVDSDDLNIFVPTFSVKEKLNIKLYVAPQIDMKIILSIGGGDEKVFLYSQLKHAYNYIYIFITTATWKGKLTQNRLKICSFDGLH